MKVELGQLNKENNAVDVTKLLLAYALRIGAVEETTWEELITTVFERPSKRFVWQTPQWPVFFARTRGERLDFTKPAGVDQQTRFLRRAANLIGMLDIPASHDLRRGAAADIYSLSPSTNIEGVRRALGHTHDSVRNGVTDRYIGRRKDDHWAARLNHSAHERDDSFGIQLASSPFTKRKIDTKDINNFCTSNNLDSTDRNDRYRARQELEKIQRDQWATHQRQILQNSTISKTTPVSSSSRESRKDITNISHLHSTDTDEENHNVAITEETVDLITSEMSNALGLADDMKGEEPSEAMIDVMSLQFVHVLASRPPLDDSNILKASIRQFIDYFSTINLISVATSELPKDAETGNSRHPPSKFLYACRKQGCRRTFNSTLHRDQHETNCQGISINTFDSQTALPDNNDYLLTVPTSRKRKSQNIHHVSEGFPKQCPDREICGVTKTFATKHLMRNHRQLHHDETWPANTACNVSGCQLPRDHFFVSREAFRRHLSSYHMLTAIECREYVGKVIQVDFIAPRGTSKSYLTTMCLFPGCQVTTEFANYSDYTTHLKRKHDQTPENYPKYLPTPNTVRLHPRPNINTIDISSPLTYDSNGLEIIPFYGTVCLHSDCQGNKKFWADEKQYKAHLKNKHDVTTMVEINSYQLWYKLKYGVAGVEQK